MADQITPIIVKRMTTVTTHNKWVCYPRGPVVELASSVNIGAIRGRTSGEVIRKVKSIMGANKADFSKYKFVVKED